MKVLFFDCLRAVLSARLLFLVTVLKPLSKPELGIKKADSCGSPLAVSLCLPIILNP